MKIDTAIKNALPKGSSALESFHYFNGKNTIKASSYPFDAIESQQAVLLPKATDTTNHSPRLNHRNSGHDTTAA